MSGPVRIRRCAALFAVTLVAAASFGVAASGSSSGVDASPIQLAALAPSDPVSSAVPSSPSSIHSEPFGLPASQPVASRLLAKWRGVESDIQADAVIIARCRAEPQACAQPAALALIAIIDAGKAREGRARLGEINRAVNLAIKPMSDMDQHGVPDVWSSPLATFTSGRGDCEDYAIAKFVALREAGVADEDLRLLVVRDASLDEYHAVVAARSEDRWLILDNRRMTLMDTAYSSYKPLFALRHEEPATVVASSTAGKADVVTSANAAPGPSGLNTAPLLL